MTRTVCVVTGSRAEYGLLRWVMDGIHRSPRLTLQTVVTGMHLAPKFGLTWREIENDGFVINRKVDTELTSDAPAASARSMGLGCIGFGAAYAELAPDVVLVLGDRFEILPAVAAALVARIPVAHAHGGELTEGAFDESIRHAITKMSHLHFVAAEEYRRRVIQMGEQPDRVFAVGGLGIDNVRKLDLFDRAGLQRALGFALGRRTLLVTFHPATLDEASAADQMAEMLRALETLDDTVLVFTMPNADTGSGALFALIERFVADHANAHVFTSMGQRLYLSCLMHSDVVIGNSSSGIIEAPALHKPTINIGDRQRGRLRAASVVDCEPNQRGILDALRTVESSAFQAKIGATRNPYGDGGASEQVVKVLEDVSLDGILKKPFTDILQ